MAKTRMQPAACERTCPPVNATAAPIRPRPMPAALFILGFMIVMALSGPAPALGQEASKLPAAGILPVSEVKPGMRGYGLSTFKGVRIEKFDLEVLGTIKFWTPGGSVILVRMSGPAVDEAGTIAGMSGSPVYIGDKLFGAVAYGFPYSKIPVAGITPIEEMLIARDMDRQDAASDGAVRKAEYRRALRETSASILEDMLSGKLSSEAARIEAASLWASPLSRARQAEAFSIDRMPQPVRGLLESSGALGMSPLPIPLVVGGAKGGACGALAPMQIAGGFLPVQGATPASADDKEEPQVAPGASVGVLLVSGDLEISGMGTLTMVDGDRVLAFGHPMLGSGQSDLPLAVGRVQAVVPSVTQSFKLATAEKVIGRLTQDRESAIVGRLGESAPMFPCTVNVKGARNQTFRYNVAGYWQMAPSMAGMVVAASATRWEGSQGLFTIKASSRITLKDRKDPIVLENVYAAESPEAVVPDLVLLPLQALMLNPFQEVGIAGVEVDVQVERGLQAARIESVQVNRPQVEPGGELDLLVTLREFHGSQQTKKVRLAIPPDAKPGTTCSILVCDSLTTLMLKAAQDPGFFNPRDMAGLIEAIQRVPRNTDIFVHASIQRRGLRYQGAAMGGLPGSVLGMLSSGTEGGAATPLLETVQTHVESPWVIEGQAQVSVVIAPYRGAEQPPE